MKKRVIIMGAGGRDFHNFNMVYRDNPLYEVVAFTATQIPFIEGRLYPPELAGSLYPRGIPIYPEGDLERLIKDLRVDEVVFSYSDVSHEYVMHRASLCLSLGSGFTLLGPDETMLESRRPVISVCAVRTGCGKSGVTRYIAGILLEKGIRPVVIRHPMAYRDLIESRCERFERKEDLSRCTIEEREEFEALVDAGITVYCGVDYREILEKAEQEASILIWDGGNNDFPFIRPDLHIVVFDPHRAGHELLYHPGETNARMAHIAVVNKVDTATKGNVERVVRDIKEVNPGATIVYTASKITVEGEERIRGRKVLVVEDGPTLTHGGMPYGAGTIAARRLGAEIVDPRPYARGSLRKTFKAYPHLKGILPAMGYSKKQIEELKETIEATPCDIVLVATPVDLKGILGIGKEVYRVRYEIEEIDGGLKGLIEGFLEGRR